MCKEGGAVPIYIVKPNKQDAEGAEKPRLVKAERVKQVEAHLLAEFTIEKADAEQAAELAGEGIRVENAAAE